MKKLLVLLLILTSCTFAFAETKTSLVKDYETVSIQVFTPDRTTPIVTVTAGNITVSGYRVIMFDEDETIYYGSDSSNTYDLPANTPLGIGGGVSTINISADCGMMVM